jgi:hypothetical protein
MWKAPLIGLLTGEVEGSSFGPITVAVTPDDALFGVVGGVLA